MRRAKLKLVLIASKMMSAFIVYVAIGFLSLRTQGLSLLIIMCFVIFSLKTWDSER